MGRIDLLELEDLIPFLIGIVVLLIVAKILDELKEQIFGKPSEKKEKPPRESRSEEGGVSDWSEERYDPTSPEAILKAIEAEDYNRSLGRGIDRPSWPF